jgi:hypothetical protein
MRGALSSRYKSGNLMTLSLKASIAGALAVALAAGVVSAQPAQENSGDGLKAACAADFHKYCPDLGASLELRACVRKNFHALSSTCRAFLLKMHGQQGHASAQQ